MIKNKNNAELVSIVLSETVACQDPTSEQSRAWADSFNMPPGPLLVSPSGTSQIPTTKLAMGALAQLASRLRDADEDLARAVSLEAVQREIARAFGENFLDLVKEQEPRRCWRLLRTRTCERLAALPADLVHYVPEWLFVGQDSGPIDIGPVRFVQRSVWPEAIGTRIGEDRPWLAGVEAIWSCEPGGSPADLPDLTIEQRLLAEQVARGAHPDQWIACVSVTGFEQRESRRRAVLAARVALDAVRLLLLRAERANIRTAVDHAAPFGTDALMQLAGRDPVWGVRVNRPGVSGAPGLARELIDNAREMLDAAGICIGQACEAAAAATSGLPGLRDRWFNSVHWFGRACVADVDYVAVVMLVISLDILSKSGEERGIVELLSLLTGHPAEAPVLSDGVTSLKKVVGRAYKLRSEIVHGSILAMHRDWEEERAQLSDLAAVALGRYALALSSYIDEIGQDDEKSFVTWLKRRNMPAQQ